VSILEHRTDIDWLRLAFRAAAEHSHDQRTQNGAVLVPEDGFVWAAANHFPPGVARCQEGADKYKFIEHAERAAIYSAAKGGTRTNGARLYCCWFACPDCARAIICAGIREVIGHVTPRSLTPDRWAEQVAVGEKMLRDAGVGMRWLAGPLGETILFDGRRVEL
jgi:dCMP deaminase